MVPMHGRVTDRRRYPVPVCRFEPDLAPWSLSAWGAALGEHTNAALALGRFSRALVTAPGVDLVRLQHACVWSVGIQPAVPIADPLLALSARLTVWHPATPIIKPIRPSMGALVQAHRALWSGQRQAGKPRSTELPSPALPRDDDGTPCLAPSPRDVLRLGASIDRIVSEFPDSLDQALVGAAWLVWAIESTSPLPDGNTELAWCAAAGWLCSSIGSGSTVLDLHASLDPDQHRQARHGLAAHDTVAAWSAHVWRTVAHACDHAIDRLHALEVARSMLLERADAMRAPRHPRELVMHLMASPITDVRQVERTLGITFAAANDLVERCIGAGILREVTGRRRGRIYCCDESAKALGPVTASLDAAVPAAGAA